MSLECAVDSECNDVINFIVSCSVVELFIKITKIRSTTTITFKNFRYQTFACVVVLEAFCNLQVLEKVAEAHLTVLVLEAQTLTFVLEHTCLYSIR